MNKSAIYLLYAFAVATVLPMSATSIVLGLLLIVFCKNLMQKTIRLDDFKRDSLLYVVLFMWKAFTRTLATSVREIPRVKGAWDRVPYIVIGFYKIHREQALRILHILFLANAIIVVYALAQMFMEIPALYKPLFYEDSGRMGGYFGHPNQYGGCISIIFIVNICLSLYQDKKFLWYAPFLLAGIVAAGSRGYFLSVFACIIIILIIPALSGSYKRMLKYSAVTLAALALIVVTVPWFSQRIASIFSLEQNVYRLNFWKISWNVFLEHPLVGVGSGMLPGYLAPFEKQGLIDNTAHAHSLYLQALAEDGIPGFILVVGAHLYFLIKYFRVFSRSAEPLLKALSLAVTLSFVNLLVAGVFENNFGAAIVAMNLNFVMGVLEGYRSAGPETSG